MANQRPTILGRIRRYIWDSGEKEIDETPQKDDTTKKLSTGPQTQKNAALVHQDFNVDQSSANLTAMSVQNSMSVNDPNAELKSFFESTNGRPLNKVEQLGVLSLISQAVARNESVTDLSSQLSWSSHSTAAQPPNVSSNLSHSFSVPTFADLSHKSMRSSRSRKGISSGPKRQSARAQIAAPKPAAVNANISSRLDRSSSTRSRLNLKSPASRFPRSETADFLESISSTDSHGLRGRAIRPDRSMFSSHTSQSTESGSTVGFRHSANVIDSSPAIPTFKPLDSPRTTEKPVNNFGQRSTFASGASNNTPSTEPAISSESKYQSGFKSSSFNTESAPIAADDEDAEMVDFGPDTTTEALPLNEEAEADKYAASLVF